jgi:hypothetical protein
MSSGFMIGVAIFLLLIVGFGWELYVAKGTQRDVTFKVNSTLSQAQGQNKSKYLVFTDSGVFQDTDSFWNLKFNSSDVFGQLAQGKTYTCRVYGFRIPLFSAYPNILRCHV